MQHCIILHTKNPWIFITNILNAISLNNKYAMHDPSFEVVHSFIVCMQESADNVSPDSTSPSKDALLEEACKKYDEATRLCPTLHDVCKDIMLYDV